MARVMLFVSDDKWEKLEKLDVWNKLYAYLDQLLEESARQGGEKKQDGK